MVTSATGPPGASAKPQAAGSAGSKKAVEEEEMRLYEEKMEEV